VEPSLSRIPLSRLYPFDGMETGTLLIEGFLIIGEIMYNWNSVIKYYKRLKKQVPKGVENREAILAGYTTYIKHLKEQRDEEMGR